jgi:membrane associated rhomboid family serine protease
MSKPKNKRQKKPDNTFSDKELNIISFFGVFISGIAYFIYNWQGLIGGALAGIVMGVFFIRWYRKRGQEENQNELKP